MSLKTETKWKVELEGALALMRFEGDITSLSRDAVLGQYEALPETVSRIILDLQKVGYLNSSGIALIIQLLMDASKRERRVRAFGLSAHFQKVFSMLGLASYLAIDANEAAARAGLEG
jgi:anti-sigma B factor antagonist